MLLDFQAQLHYNGLESEEAEKVSDHAKLCAKMRCLCPGISGSVVCPSCRCTCKGDELIASKKQLVSVRKKLAEVRRGYAESIEAREGRWER